jgi:hypothetical protein
LIAELPMDRLGLLFDAVIAVLLVATIVYAAVLDRKLSVLRDCRAEMEQLIGRFTQATGRAEKALAEIRHAAGETGQALQSSIEKGNTVADDLMFLVERAGSLADRLERAGGAARGTPRPDHRPGEPCGVEVTAAPSPAAAELVPPEGGAEDSAFLKSLRGMR